MDYPGRPNTPLTRAEIVDRLRTRLNMTVFGANAMVRVILQVFRRNLVEGKTIELRAVGKFETQVKAARLHHMVHETGANRMKMSLPRRVLRFSPSKMLRSRMIKHHKAHSPPN